MQNAIYKSVKVHLHITFRILEVHLIRFEVARLVSQTNEELFRPMSPFSFKVETKPFPEVIIEASSVAELLSPTFFHSILGGILPWYVTVQCISTSSGSTLHVFCPMTLSSSLVDSHVGLFS